MAKVEVNKSKYLSDPILCYLTGAAEKELDRMEREYGLDRDLALTLLEMHWSEEELFLIPDNVNNE